MFSLGEMGFLNLVADFDVKDVRGWQFLTIEAAESLCMVFVPSEEHFQKKNIEVIDLSNSLIF